MSVLSQKLQEAMKLFQTHNFAKSLEAYDDCITFCQKTEEDRAVIHNILSTKATLQYILGKYDDSLKTLNGVLKKDPYHFLSLLRRSQVYKKKNKLKKALKDLEAIFVFCPDNLQISAFKVEIEHLLLKQQHQQDITSQSQNESDEEKDELNFINLKLIDRKSIDKAMMKERKSRVTILGDTTFEYRREDDDQKKQQGENFNDKALRTYKQIELDDENEDEINQMPIIRIKAPKRGKSILKNKATSIFIHEDSQEGKRSKYLGRQSNLLSLIKNIEGKLIISAEHEHQSNPSIKQVQFRKSMSSDQNFLNVVCDNKSTTSSKRKSCLKRPSFDINNKPIRLSRFQSIDSNKIDGHLIISKKRKSIEKNSDAQSHGQVDEVKNKSDSDSQGSEHNIFGSKRLVLSTQLKQKLGIKEGQGQQMSRSYNSKLQAKKSILKKNSSVIIPSPVKKTSCVEKQALTKSNFSLKSKKSVMFNCTL